MGSLENALKFANHAKRYGADILKVQVYKPSTITLDSTNEDFQILKMTGVDIRVYIISTSMLTHHGMAK